MKKMQPDVEQLESKARQIGSEGEIRDVQLLQSEVQKIKDTMKDLQREAATRSTQLHRVAVERDGLVEDLLAAVKKIHEKGRDLQNRCLDLEISVSSVDSTLADLKSIRSEVLPLGQSLGDRMNEQRRRLTEHGEPIPDDMQRAMQELEDASVSFEVTKLSVSHHGVYS